MIQSFFGSGFHAAIVVSIYKVIHTPNRDKCQVLHQYDATPLVIYRLQMGVIWPDIDITSHRIGQESQDETSIRLILLAENPRMNQQPTTCTPKLAFSIQWDSCSSSRENPREYLLTLEVTSVPAPCGFTAARGPLMALIRIY